MPHCSIRTAIATALVILGSALPATAQLTTPAEWRWRLERPALLVTGQEVPDSAWRFVGMPPGWHVTSGPSVVLYPVAERAAGRYSLSADFVVFPESTDQPFGLILGGTELGSPTGSWTGVQLRRDGTLRIVAGREGQERVLAPWTGHAAIRPHPGKGVITNRLRVSVAADSLRVFVNDSAVAAVGAAGLTTEGQFGFQIGEKLNLHITTLDHIRHLAPGRRP